MKTNTSDSRLEWFNVGDYKQRPNMVGDSKTTPPSRVKKEMQRLFQFIVDERHKLYYYRGLKEFENEQGYLIDTCLSAQDMYSELLEYFTEE